MNQLHSIWGINFFLSDLDGYFLHLDSILSDKDKIVLTGINPYSLSIVKKNPIMLDALQITTIANVDGILLKFSLQLMGYNVPARLDTPSLFYRLMDLCARKKLRIFLLGSHSEDMPIITSTLLDSYPGIIISGSHHGFFDKDDEKEIIDKINKCKSDVLILGMPSPKKEVFVYDNLKKLNIKLSLGVGGVFDILAGKKKPAPSMIKKLNIEWLYRFVQEPVRLFQRYKDMFVYFTWFIFANRKKVQPYSTKPT